MPLPNVFEPQASEEIIARIEQLRPDSQRLWGKMDVGQMLAHLCVTYEMIYDPEKHKKPNFLMRLILGQFVKKIVTNEIPYGKNKPTAPAFKMVSQKDFEVEKGRLIEYIRQTRSLGAAAFEGKESQSFGVLTSSEWNNMMYKHLNHHLGQFGV